MFCFRRQGSRVQGFKGSSIICILFFLLLTPHSSLLTVSHAQGNHPFITDNDQFNYASFLLKQGHFSAAAREFGRVIEQFPSSPHIPTAQYMVAESYFKAGRYNDAIKEFTQFALNFPDNKLVSDAISKKDVLQVKLKESIGFPQPLSNLKTENLNFKSDFKIRAAQILLFKGKTYEEVEQEIVKLKDSGINTIIVRVFQNKGDRFYPFVTPKAQAGVYFETKNSPVIEDILGKITEYSHKNGLKIFAWMTTRYADYGIGEKIDLKCKSYDFVKNKIVPCKGLDFFNEEAVLHLERIYKDLARYDIDGILFQDDLHLKHNEGFGQYASALYLTETGKILNPSAFNLQPSAKNYTAEFWEWASWKNKRLLNAAKRLMKTVKEINPKIKFSINLMYESVSNPAYALAWLSQSLEESVAAGFDYYAVMAYHIQMQDELKKDPLFIESLIEDMTREAVERVGSPSKVLMKVQTIDWDTLKPLPDKEILELLKRINNVSDVSLAVVPYRIDFPFQAINEIKKSQ